MSIEKSIRIVRLDAIFEAIKNGQASNDELLKAAKNAEYHQSIRRGWNTESRFMRYIKRIPIIETVKRAAKTEEGSDQSKGIDFWLIFKNHEIPNLPLQLKSSDSYVNRFKRSQKYLDLNKAVIVLNVGQRKSRTEFKQDFYYEFHRVINLIKENPLICDRLTSLYQSSNN